MGFLTGLNSTAQHASPHVAEMRCVFSTVAARSQAQSDADTEPSWLLCWGATANSPEISFVLISGTLEMSKAREIVLTEYQFLSWDKSPPTFKSVMKFMAWVTTLNIHGV